MKPKILIISREFYPQIAGVSTYISEIERRLGGEKIIIAQYMRNRKRNDVIGINYPKLVASRYLRAAYFVISSVAKSLALKYDVVVGNALIGSAAASIVKMISGKPSISIIYDVDQIKKDVSGLGAINKIIRKFLQKIILDISDAVVVDSQKVKRDILKLHRIRAGKIHVVESGFNIDKNFKDARKPAHTKVILFVGINTKKKGLEDLVNAFAQVKKSVPDSILWIVGPNTGFLQSFHKELLYLATKLNVLDDITFFGEVPSTSPFYKACDVFVLPSHHSEGFGIPCVEAGYFSKPVVATKIFEETGVVVDGKTGIIVEPHRSDELAKAVLKILGNPRYARKLGSEGKKHSFKYSWERATREFEKVLNDL